MSIKSAVESIGLARVINEIGIEKLFEKLSEEQREKILKILTKKEE